ncbi:unnamed protein product [Thelazia callipaeda]|uniref:Lipase_GDSL domain-containing protein n=1 Tax=Thelazia callipaeda TaxID=103827 RepID=A0A0N5CVW9_THECL|nr:unnamed protein product [Thelazia callipaeda]
MAQFFVNKDTFACPRLKKFIRTGDSLAALSPEDISIIAAMGDSLAVGKRLWRNSDIEMRGGAFPIGGDTDLNYIISIPNILKEFNSELKGQSHGIGTSVKLPDSQMNCARSDAGVDDLLEQTNELIRRLDHHYGRERLKKEWILIIITLGTDQICRNCSSPDFNILLQALEKIQRNCPRTLVVLVGPILFQPIEQFVTHILRQRCACIRQHSFVAIKKLYYTWNTTFNDLHNLLNKEGNSNFGVVVLPFLSLTGARPTSLFVYDQLLLNKRGHAFAARWLWNRLITGDDHENETTSDYYMYCPLLECPYLRTESNKKTCLIRNILNESESEAASPSNRSTYEEHFDHLSALHPTLQGRENMRQHLLLVITIISASSLITVIVLGTIFYQIGLRAQKSRFDIIKGV